MEEKMYDDTALMGLLYKKRLELGWTMTEAAARIGIHKSTLSRYEVGEVHHMTPDIRRRILEVYHLENVYNVEDAVNKYTQNGGVSMPLRESAVYSFDGRMLTEEELLHRYRQMDRRGRLRISCMMQGMDKRYSIQNEVQNSNKA